MARSLESVDAEHALAYLESSNPRNVAFYERLGFEVVGRMQIGDSPTLTAMRRPARRCIARRAEPEAGPGPRDLGLYLPESCA